MLRSLCRLFLIVAFVAGVTGCAEDDIKTTKKVESTTESQPTDISPGEAIVESAVASGDAKGTRSRDRPSRKAGRSLFCL